MRILYDHQIFAAQRHGGISRYFFELAKELAACQKVDVSLFMGLHRSGLEWDSIRPSLRRSPGLKLDVPRTVRLFTKLNDACFIPWAKRNRAEFDIYHPTYYRNSAPVGLYPTVVTVYDMIYEQFAQTKERHHPVIAAKRDNIARADMVVAISQATKNELMNILGIPPERVRVIHLGNSLAQYGGIAPYAHGRPYLLYVGLRTGPGDYKNFSLLIEMLGRHKELRGHLDILAFGGGAFSSEERRRIASAGLEGKVFQVSGDDAKLASLYNGAVCLVYPSKCEGFGIPIVEAMGLSCPVVTGTHAALREVAADAALFRNPDDIDAFAGAVEDTMNEAVRSSLIARGLRRSACFTWDATARQTLEVYREVHAKRGSMRQSSSMLDHGEAP